MHFETLFKIFRKQGSRSSVAFYARADCKSTGCMKFTLDACSTPARACIPSLERTVNTCKVLDTRISHSSVTFPARADCMNSECTLERGVPRSSMDPKSGISRLILKHKTQLLKLQTQFFWTNFLENT